MEIEKNRKEEEEYEKRKRDGERKKREKKEFEKRKRDGEREEKEEGGEGI